VTDSISELSCEVDPLPAEASFNGVRHSRIAREVSDGTGQLADHMQCWHSASMSVQITIRDVSEKVRDELAARAALQGKSMQEYLRAELERLAARPSIDTWLQQVRRRKSASQTRVSSAQILQNRDTDRR
jgi:plasmid stability protein